ncbi:RNA pseudouridine synthase [Verminephrobacter eiseniae]|uniref:Dual-specificity RNA pseudouridine synthase RluF n=1 Tax=Verminephrobacter eiseniae (strain EF01-2) TaxID=391735 RepID=A1WJ35_VEREI|nr:RNA pseudouridine synthase [Verminephrobacter eiseniae]ABM57642.1 RNA-binding S4 domain protein [Verminephrobacter eiseniae EF01-2]MCW5262830.1 RNA-binding protein [Verminephrobacter eiseniae]MCW5283262.1 RNA-binding protein [Verminephrobacter eiseniae]MCW5303578.1 RNA-binding protein [Verminephrobacter eiseniae]MCW8188372.1 RNA-binding protein [Verminephrobacter eiseniae]
MTENQPDPGLLRLTRRVARQLNCSRSTAEQLIENGCVSVQGQVVQAPGARVSAQQNVTVAQDAALPDPRPVTLLLHKPAGFAASSAAPPDGPQASALLHAASHLAEDASGMRVLPRHFLHLACLTPLPTEASGLVVYTQDRRLARVFAQDFAQDMALRQPAQQTHSPEQECIVQVAGTIAPDGLQRLRQGLLLDGLRLPPIRASWQNETRLRFALKGVRPGQIPAICAAVGLTVEAIKRIRIGRVALARQPPGQWRYLLPWERF